MLGNGFMARAHTKAMIDLRVLAPELPPLIFTSICARNVEKLRAACQQHGWLAFTTDAIALATDPEIDVLVIASPNGMHCAPALAAVAAGKHVLCDKPLAPSPADAYTMATSACAARITHLVGYNFRFAPAVRLAYQLIRDGEIGEPLLYRARFLESTALSPGRRRTWRDNTEHGGGALLDLGSHVVDLARWLVGDVTHAQAVKRPDGDEAQGGPACIDDSISAVLEFASGAVGTVEASRVAGRTSSLLAVEVDGTLGSLRFRSDRLNFLEHADTSQSVRILAATAPSAPYMDLWWPLPGHPIGWGDTFAHQARHLFEAVTNGISVSPIGADFMDGYRCAAVVAAISTAATTHERTAVATQPIAGLPLSHLQMLR